MNKALNIVWLAVSALAGCSLTPHYERPAAPVAANYPGQVSATDARSTAAADIGWRAFFPDPRLQALIATALANNRDLRMAALRIEEARAQYGIQSADRWPTVNAAAGASRARTPDVLTNGRSNLSSRYEVGLNLAAFELDFFGRVRSLNEAALAQYLATREARQAAQISLVAEVAKAYLTERAYAEQQALAQKTLQGREAAYELAQKRFDVGASSALDLRLGESLLQSARVSLATLARQRAQAENALTLLVGTPLADISPAPAPSAQNAVIAIPAGLPSDLLARRPDIRAAEQQLIAANANIGAARAAFFPRISLTAGVGTASPALSGLFDAGTQTWSFAPQLLLPIFDAGRNRANLDLAQVRKNLMIANYEKAIQTAFREVADTLVARAALDDQVAAQQAMQRAEAERLELSALRFQNGVDSSLAVLDAERELFAAEQQLVQTLLLRQVNAVDLYRALGGGLNETTPREVGKAR